MGFTFLPHFLLLTVLHPNCWLKSLKLSPLKFFFTRERGSPKKWCPHAIAIRKKGRMKYNGRMAKAIDASAGQCSGIVYDSHGQGLAAPEVNLVSAKPDSPKNHKEFLPLGFTAEWTVSDGVPKGLRRPSVHARKNI